MGRPDFNSGETRNACLVGSTPMSFRHCSGIGAMFAGFGAPSFGSILTDLLIMVAGAVGARIWCELLIVLSKIHENLKKLADRGL